MSIDKYDPFAKSGPMITDEALATIVDNGLVNEPLRYTLFNKLHNRADSKIVELIEFGPTMSPGDDNDILQIWSSDKNDGFIVSDKNRIAANPYPNPIYYGWSGIAPAKIGGKRKILTTAQYAEGICIWDVETMTHESTTPDLAAAISLSGYYPCAVCCDANYAYVLLNNPGATPVLMSYSLADWSPNPSWPAGGVTLSAYAKAFDLNDATVINASFGYIAVSQPWVNVTSGASAGIAIVDRSDGSILGVGAGDTSVSSSGTVEHITSNGTYVFFSVVSTSGNVEIASMDIANPGANGIGGTYWPVDTGVEYDKNGGIACCGDTVVATFEDGFFGGTGTVFQKYTVSRGLVADFQTGSTTDLGILNAVVFNSKDFWAIGVKDEPGIGAANSYSAILVKLKGVMIHGKWSNDPPNYCTITNAENYVDVYTLRGDDGGTEIGNTFSYPRLTAGISIAALSGDIWIASNGAGQSTGLQNEVVRARKTYLR